MNGTMRTKPEPAILLAEEIIGGLCRDDPRAMKSVYEHYYMPLCHYAGRYVGTAAVAEEIVSDVMYKVWQHRQSGYRADTFREYLFAAVRNTAINYLEQQRRRRDLAEEWAEQLRDELIGETPLDELLVSELQQKIDALVNALPEQCRKVYRLSRAGNLTYGEIAGRMQISVSTVKYHITTALLRLRNGLRDFLIWTCLLILVVSG
jgi:RNA polymerase sigma-70 factor (ECF subfamily)